MFSSKSIRLMEKIISFRILFPFKSQQVLYSQSFPAAENIDSRAKELFKDKNASSNTETLFWIVFERLLPLALILVKSLSKSKFLENFQVRKFGK